MPLDLLATLRELVAIPSVNPMGRDVSGPEYFEYRVTDYLEQLFKSRNIVCSRQHISPQRENLIALVPGDPLPEAGGKILMWEAHQDTVPVDGMIVPPFEPELRDGRLYGRGSCDVKGGMTAMLGALVRLAEQRPKPRPSVVMACTVNEEHGFTGAMGLCRLWSELPSAIFPRKPDAVVSAEPTNLQVVVAHKGAVRWRCHTLGRAGHSSDPARCENAVFRMARVLLALERYQREIVGTLAEHPRCGQATLSVGTIRGGISVNTVPDRCSIEIDRRLVPGESPETAYQHVIDFLAEETGIRNYIEHDPPFMQSRGLADSTNGALADRLAAAVKSAAGVESRKIGVAFGTDASCFDGAGVPSVVFGPGSIQQAHTVDEWVPMVEVEQASDVLYRFALDWMEG